MTNLTRADLLRGGAAVVLAGGVLAGSASADPIQAADLAYVRLLVTAELLAADFYTQAIAASNTSGAVRKHLERAAFNEQEHYASVSGILTGAGQTPAVAGDIDFGYPKGTFDSQGSIVTFAAQLEATLIGAYAGAIGAMQTNQFKTGLTQIAACEGEHAAYFQLVAHGMAFELSFPPALTIQQASDALGAYTA
jgi:hypothetical protein